MKTPLTIWLSSMLVLLMSSFRPSSSHSFIETLNAPIPAKSVTVVSMNAYWANRYMKNSPPLNEYWAGFGIKSILNNAIINNQWNGQNLDWDTVLKAAKALTGNKNNYDRAIDIYIVFQIETTSQPIKSKVTIQLYCTPPQTPTRPKYQVSQTVTMGDSGDYWDDTVSSTEECIFYAARNATKVMLNSGVLNSMKCN